MTLEADIPGDEGSPGSSPRDRDRSRGLPRMLLAIILAGVFAHGYRIDNPLFDKHIYRQFDTAAVARNYADSGMNFFYPQVDWRGSSSGYVEVEFPAYNYAAASLQRVFGPRDWTGRVVSTLCYVLSAIVLFLLVRRIFDERAALFSVLFYSLLPFTLYHTRTVQPDPLLALGSIAGVYYFWSWTESGRWRDLAVAWAGVTIAVLIKPPSLYLAVPLAYLSLRAFGPGAFRQAKLWGFVVAVLAPVFLWYYHAYGLWIEHGNTFGIIGTTPQQGLWGPLDERWLTLGRAMIERIGLTHATPAGLVFLAAGLLLRPGPRSRVLLWWAVGFAVFMVLLPNAHLGHDYYQLPLAFIVLAFMGYGAVALLDRGVPRVVVGALTAVMLLSSAYIVRPWYDIRPVDMRRLEFARVLAGATEREDLLIMVDPTPQEDDPAIYRHRTPDGDRLYVNPIDFYNADRVGWSLHDHQATPELVERLRVDGAAYLATFWPRIVFERRPMLKEMLDRQHTPVEVTDRWAIYRLDVPGAGDGTPDQGPP